MSNIKNSMIFVMAGLQKLQDDERIRYEGNAIFQEVKQELAGAIEGFDAYIEALPVTEPAPVVMHVMNAEQMDDLIRALRAESESSDVAVLAAIAHSQIDVIAAITAPAKAAA